MREGQCDRSAAETDPRSRVRALGCAEAGSRATSPQSRCGRVGSIVQSETRALFRSLRPTSATHGSTSVAFCVPLLAPLPGEPPAFWVVSGFRAVVLGALCGRHLCEQLLLLVP